MDDTLRSWLFDPRAHRIASGIVVFFAVFVVTRLVERSISRYVKSPETRYRARKAVDFLGYSVAVLVVAAVVSDRLGGLGVALGVVGAGVAFALQEFVLSVAGGVAISFGNFYGPWDRVEIGGIRGDVIDIGILRTTLMAIGDYAEQSKDAWKHVVRKYRIEEARIGFATAGFQVISAPPLEIEVARRQRSTKPEKEI